MTFPHLINVESEPPQVLVDAQGLTILSPETEFTTDGLKELIGRLVDVS